MDFYNPLYHLLMHDEYVGWHSVYPPLSYVLLKPFVFLYNSNLVTTSDALRPSTSLSTAIFATLYFFIVLLMTRISCWRFHEKPNYLLIFLFYATSFPMLFALERGNLIILAPLLISMLIRWAKLRCLILAVLINLKPYFILLGFSLFRSQKILWQTIIATVILFFITGFIIGDGFLNVFSNFLMFASGGINDNYLHALTMVINFSYVVDVLNVFSAAPTNMPVLLILLIRMLLAILFIFCIIVLIRFGKNVRFEILALYCIALVINFGGLVGGYALILYLPFIPFLMTKYQYKNVFFIIILILSPIDFIPIFIKPYLFEMYSYLSGDSVKPYWFTPIASLLRPVLNLIVLLQITHIWFQNDKQKKLLS